MEAAARLGCITISELDVQRPTLDTLVTARARGGKAVGSRIDVGAQRADEGHQLVDLIVRKVAAERGHPSRLAILDAVEDLLVRHLGAHQLRTFSSLSPVVFVAEAADVAERVFR